MKKYLFRPQRGGLSDAMKLLKEFDSLSEMLDHIVESYNDMCVNPINKEDVSFHLYVDEEDNRIGWNKTYIIMTDGFPFGFFTDDYNFWHREAYDEFTKENL